MVKASLRLERSRPPLERVELDLRSAGFETINPFGAKFPAMEKLILSSYTWDHPQAESDEIWDLSRLRSLCLKRKVLTFLKCAPLSQLTQLEALKLIEWSANESKKASPGSVRGLLGGLIGKLQSVKNLKIETENWQEMPPMEAVIGMGSRLKKLRLRNVVAGGTMNITLPVSQLSQLQRACPNLTYLGLDLSMSNSEASYSM